MKRIIRLSITFCVIVILLFFLMLRSSFVYKHWFYLVKKENYISIEAEIDVIRGYDRYDENYCFLVKNCSYPLQRIIGDSSLISVSSKTMNVSNHKRDILELEAGDVIEFVTAPRFMGNGWVFPIVALKIDGETVIEFEDGYKYLMNHYLDKYYDLRLFRWMVE